MKKSIFILRNLYILLFILTIASIIFTPLFVKEGISLIDEETLEVVIIGLLFVVSYIIYVLYKNEIEKNQAELINLKEHRLTLEERLDEAFRHIGQVNVQIKEIKSIFSGYGKYPESKNDFKNILKYFTGKILSLAAVDWVILKIVDMETARTLSEHSQCREGAAFSASKIGNLNLINQTGLEPYSVLCSDRDDLKIKVCCLTPKITITGQTQVFIKAIICQLEMLFLIFSSNYFKNGKAKNN